ncbi:MAG: universal stress protein UspA [Peptococcaceae bacterium BRH_c4a]|nr:MAG: universal stress protein UspA [Peptococcaceae bacterium BRH_c4a]
MYKKIMVPTDGSKKSELAVQQGIQLAGVLKAVVVVLHVIPEIPTLVTPYPDQPGGFLSGLSEELDRSGEEILEKAKDKYADSGVDFQTKLLRGSAAHEICNEAKKGQYDLIVMASRGMGEIQGYLMGSVSNRVVRRAGCSVLIIR